MEYRSLGRSAIRVSAIGFGCGGNAQLMVGDDEALRLETVGRAIAAGINFFDTAPAYGDGRSETNLGRALRALDAKPVVSTKVVLQDADRRDPGSAVVRNVEDSLARLGMQQVDILVLHNRVFVQPDGTDWGIAVKLSIDEVLGPKGVVAGFERLISSGVTKAVGFTAFGGDITAITTLIDSRAFDVMNASLSLLNPSAAVRVPTTFAEPDYERIITHAHAADVGVMAIRVLARGALTGPGPRSGPAADIAGLVSADSLPSTAIRYVLGKAGVSTAILGLSQPNHVDEAVAAVAKGPLPAELERALEMVAIGQ